GDIRLPDMNGYDFYVRMRVVLPTSPVVLMTGFGYDPTHSLVKARQEGLRTALYKPFRFDRLREAVEDSLHPNQRPSGDGLKGPINTGGQSFGSSGGSMFGFGDPAPPVG
ncbi:MAG: response regulator, partial [Planctomycetia bacterium]